MKKSIGMAFAVIVVIATGVFVAPAALAQSIIFSQWWSSDSKSVNGDINTASTGTVKEASGKDDTNLPKEVHITMSTDRNNPNKVQKVVLTTDSKNAESSSNQSNVQFNLNSSNNSNSNERSVITVNNSSFSDNTVNNERNVDSNNDIYIESSSSTETN